MAARGAPDAAPEANSFDIPGVLSGVSKGPPQLVHRRIEAVLEVDEGAILPDLRSQMLAGDHLARGLEQLHQDFEGLTGQPDANAALEQLTGGGVDLKGPETQSARCLIRVRHGLFLSSRVYYDALWSW
jgi:hypothetical protein